VAMLTCYQLGGGNLSMAPFLIMMAMLCVWAVPPKISRPMSIHQLTAPRRLKPSFGPAIE
jgi:hypothetical protein